MTGRTSRLSRGPGPATYANGDRIEQIVRHHERLAPDAVAVRQGERVLSYRDLVDMADRVAAGLVERGVTPGDVVPVRLPRSPELVAVLLGVLTAGAAYLAMDPGWPANRQEYVLASSGAGFLITPAGDPPPPPGVHPLTTTDLLAGGGAAVPSGLSGTQAASVFYTSGSTGRPKGVVSPHRGTVRVLVGNDGVPLDADTVFLQAAPLPWDGLSLELWAPLLNGGCCVLLDEGAPLLDVAALRNAVGRGVNSLWLTSSLFNVFVDEAVELFGAVRLVLVGGERVSVSHVRRLLDRFPELPVINGYGPAESTIFTTTHVIRQRDVRPPSVDIPIGRPVPGTGVVVVDEELRPLPAGSPGELLVSGDGLAAGYLGDPDQTSRAFVEVDGVRYYRTGDLVVLDDQVFRYRGRIDRQVKVNGVRIEPGEVEAALERHPAVRVASVVRVETDGRPRLVALFESAGGVAPTTEELRTFAAERLLPAMIPAILHRVERLPLGSTGKVDLSRVRNMAELLVRAGVPETGPAAPTVPDPARSHVEPARSGPDPDRPRADPAAAGAGPGGADVPFLAVVRSVLGVPDLGLDDDLFAAGATSLDLVRLTSRSAVALPAPVSLADVYRARTVQGLLEVAAERAETESGRVEVAAVRAETESGRAGGASADDAPLSHAQTRFWLSEQFQPGAADNMVVLAYLVTGRWEPGVLRRAVADVVERHPVLRTVYAPAGRTAAPRTVGTPVTIETVPAPAGTGPYPGRGGQPGGNDVDVDAAAHLMTEDWWRTPFDLATEPPLRIRVGRLDEDRYLLGLHIHHIAFDGWSERILMADLETAYRARATGAAPVFPDVPTYLTYSRAERGSPATGVEAKLRHWRDVLEPPIPPAFAPPHPDTPEGPRCELTRTLPGALVGRLRAVASRYGAPAASVLSAAVAHAVGRTFGVPEVCVGTVAPSRPDPYFDGVIGYFVDPLPLALRTAGDPGGQAVLTESTAQLRAAMDGNVVPFDELVRALKPARGRHPWFQTWVVVQHEPPRGELSPHVRYRPVRVRPPSTAMELLVEAVPQEVGGWELVLSCRADGIGTATLRNLAETLVGALVRYADHDTSA
ncbi:amino acid adenylation domain-containing protein [Micromonospora cathayae]|uniref:Amino acid adenylation domain-containing protein n=1 Tax=Micromonospora cathayae TaxID=3028804 RepID=A0ABY7ZWU3_9ACTN|nr:amino acid adenylation domain-containing protein [Micromonospora sp. HUAS 3]WDZ86244.1 amino acid adenylation domain-containing protein [Micromonospora sp. HUAS 3]